MDVNSQYLFIYGTLLSSKNTYGDFLRRNSKLLSTGTFKGELFNIGQYPGALYKPDNELSVFGSIVQLMDAEKVLRVLDDYEGYGFSEAQPNEYTREVITITGDNGSTYQCWVYLYNLPVKAYPQILSGRWV